LESEAEGNGTNLSDRLEQLSRISKMLAELNARLRSELDGSRKNSEELRHTLERSKSELDEVRAELERLRGSSTALWNVAEDLPKDLEGLREALMRAESSLRNLEQSFAAYRQTAELKIGSLEKSRNFYRAAFFTAAGFAAAGGIIAGVYSLSK
jgi:predicted nuclease with TOPRIM domain